MRAVRVAQPAWQTFRGSVPRLQLTVDNASIARRIPSHIHRTVPERNFFQTSRCLNNRQHEPSRMSPAHPLAHARPLTLPFADSAFVRRVGPSRALFLAILLFSGMFYLINSDTIPETGRRRFRIKGADLEQLVEGTIWARDMGDHSKHLYRGNTPLGKIYPESDFRVRLARKVLDRLMPLTDVVGPNCDVFVLHNDKVPGAFVNAAGKVVIFSGLFRVVQTEDQLATVLSHEISHVRAQHSAEKWSSDFATTALISLGAPMLIRRKRSSAFWVVKVLFGWALARGFVQIYSHLPNSRLQETEADYMGLMMMSQACYDPRHALGFWRNFQRMTPDNNDENAFWLSTHPRTGERIQNIERWLPQAMQTWRESGCQRSTYGRFW